MSYVHSSSGRHPRAYAAGATLCRLSTGTRRRIRTLRFASRCCGRVPRHGSGIFRIGGGGDGGRARIAANRRTHGSGPRDHGWPAKRGGLVGRLAEAGDGRAIRHAPRCSVRENVQVRIATDRRARRVLAIGAWHHVARGMIGSIGDKLSNVVIAWQPGSGVARFEHPAAWRPPRRPVVPSEAGGVGMSSRAYPTFRSPVLRLLRTSSRMDCAGSQAALLTTTPYSIVPITSPTW